MPDHVRIRMYNVGFGNCFLLEFPRGEGVPARILVDCGAHTAGYPKPGWKPADTAKQIVADITEDSSAAAIDVVVASHRHQDHVSGFAAREWSTVTVDQVWLPWTEDPHDPRATDIRNRQSRLALGLQLAFSQDQFAQPWEKPEIVESLRSLAVNNLTNEAAMRTLHRGFLGHPTRQYLSAAAEVTVPECPELKVHVLGPSRQPGVIREMDPPRGASYLQFQARADGGEVVSEAGMRATSAFAKQFSLAPQQFETDPATQAQTLSVEIKNAAAGVMSEENIAVAVALEKAVNGTSLMLMFEFRDAFLLFPGDAQWGTWNAALTDPITRDLLSRTTFYKVGHHGSHNATPMEFVEQVLDPARKIWGAAASVHPIKMLPEIPRAPLLEALGKHADRVVRSDEPGAGDEGLVVRGGGSIGVDFHVPC
jgi:beta-lactamase superfamily II metal-dependent hydrolase